jgi:16S rRNA (cytosine967-C5)-methyltransferase
MSPRDLLTASSELLALVLKFDHPADAVVSRFFREHRVGSRERATLAETVYAVLRRKNLYEFLAKSAPKGAGSVARRMAILAFHGSRDFIKSALNADEKQWLDACDAAMESGHGLLDLHRHNLPEWLAQRLKAQLGEQFWPLVKSLELSAPLDLRVNVLKQKRDVARMQLAQSAIKSVVSEFSPWGLRIEGKPALNTLDAFKNGEIEVQDEGSQLLALLLDAGRGEMVVDFCAGAGGKTLAIGAMMKNTGRLYALDVSAHRLDALKPRLARSGLSNVHPVAIAHERDERIKRLAGKIDRVLVDAPCSGMGTLRRNPDLKWRQTPQDLEELNAKQSAILTSAARLVKSGGRLIYATCSLLHEENEAIAQAFSAAHPEFTALSAADVLAQLKVPRAEQLCTSTTDDAEQGGAELACFLRLWPHVHQTDGFFAAIWQRK